MLRVALSHILGGGRGFIQMDSRSLSATVGDGPERGHLSGLTGRPRSQSHSPQSKPLLLLLHHPLLPLSSFPVLIRKFASFYRWGRLLLQMKRNDSLTPHLQLQEFVQANKLLAPAAEKSNNRKSLKHVRNA